MEVENTTLTQGSANLESLPSDLIMEIMKRLPVENLIRFLTLSKFWSSIIRGKYFKKLFLHHSLTKPKSLVFISRKLSFREELKSKNAIFEVFKSTREPSPSSSSLSSASLSTYHVRCYKKPCMTISPTVHGLICYGPASSLAIYNPCTRRSITLPSLRGVRRRAISYYIGYDPIGNDYKVLCITVVKSELSNRVGLAENIWVLTLGSLSWRMCQNIIPPHSPDSQQLCINGVLYYTAFVGEKLSDTAIIRFDVRSEKLDVIKGPCTFPYHSKLTSYEGKLAVIYLEGKVSAVLWILEDGSKEKWLKKTFGLPPVLAVLTRNPNFYWNNMSATMDTDTGEIIVTPVYVQDSLPSAIYCDINKNTTRSFQVEGATNEFVICQFVCCEAENLMFL